MVKQNTINYKIKIFFFPFFFFLKKNVDFVFPIGALGTETFRVEKSDTYQKVNLN